MGSSQAPSLTCVHSEMTLLHLASQTREPWLQGVKTSQPLWPQAVVCGPLGGGGGLAEGTFPGQILTQ